jgi:four helix bundle protein
MQSYRRLPVWKKAHSVALEIDALSRRIPRGRHAGLVQQLQRASLSIPANIAEGCSRATDRDFAKFLQVALASATEVEYHLEFAVDASIIPRSEFTLRQSELIEIRRMLSGFVKYLRRSGTRRAALDPPKTA